MVKQNGGSGAAVAVSFSLPFPFTSIPIHFHSHLFSGPAGYCPPVRARIYRRVYVCSSPIEVSSRWPVSSPLLDEFSRVSPAGGERALGPARIFDTHVPPRAGCLVSTAGVTRSYAASARLSLAFGVYPRDLPGLRKPGHATPMPPYPSNLCRARWSIGARNIAGNHPRFNRREPEISRQLCDVRPWAGVAATCTRLRPPAFAS